MPPCPPSRYAIEGTAAHKIAEMALKGHLYPETNPALFELVGVVIEAQGAKVTASDDMCKAVAVWVMHCIEIIHQALDADREWPRIGIEMWMPMPWLGDTGRRGGTGDLVVISEALGRVWIRDYKHGSGIFVPHVNNPQLLAYATAALELWRREIGGPDPIVDYGIVQPRFEGAVPVRSDVLHAEDLDYWRDVTLREAIERSERPDAPLIAGDHCQFCAVKSACMVHMEWKRAMGPRATARNRLSPPPPVSTPHAEETLPSWLTST